MLAADSTGVNGGLSRILDRVVPGARYSTRMMTAPFDRYSLTHAAVGAIFELSRIPAGVAIGSHVAFEAVEDSVKRGLKRVWPDTSPESLVNHVGDLASFTGGYYAARGLSHSRDGQVALTALVAAGAGVWAWSLMRGELWSRPA